ncbi:hypothetical protein QYF36_001946 [Acer negundo]|nr:hypothetical protein QYF36_001946 [Acer negundo]
MVESKLTYEECRRQRLEENKKRMEELNLTNLSHSLKKPTNTNTPSPLKKRVRTEQVEQVRRSSRVANKPSPNYKDIGSLSSVFTERVYAIEKADQLQSGLDSQFPSFVKPMLHSHVNRGFWLGLPVQFCKNHLPPYDETITLVDEEGNEFPTKFLADKTGLSGGWRGFSLDHELIDGDALVFHLVMPTTFKVYIIRAYETEENEDDNDKTKEIKDNNDNKDKNEDSDVAHLSRSAKRTRASRK